MVLVHSEIDSDRRFYYFSEGAFSIGILCDWRAKEANVVIAEVVGTWQVLRSKADFDLPESLDEDAALEIAGLYFADWMKNKEVA